MRDAPLEVIKASYRALSQKYHPDRNRDPGALHTMKTINLAWDVLSDPERRAKHDDWIANQEQRARSNSAQERISVFGDVGWRYWFRHTPAKIAGSFVLLQLAIFGIIYLTRSTDSAGIPPIETEAAAPATAVSAPVERLPHGYLPMDEHDPSRGPAAFEFDNTSGEHDAEVRLYRDGRPASRLFVHQGLRYSAEGLAFGTYSMKYKIVVDGKARVFQADDNFRLIQTPEEAREGRYNKFNKIRITKFDSTTGKAKEIPADQF